MSKNIWSVSFHLIITAVLQDVVSDEEVKQSPPPAVETEDDIVDECVEEGPENYAKEHTKKVCLL